MLALLVALATLLGLAAVFVNISAEAEWRRVAERRHIQLEQQRATWQLEQITQTAMRQMLIEARRGH